MFCWNAIALTLAYRGKGCSRAPAVCGRTVARKFEYSPRFLGELRATRVQVRYQTVPGCDDHGLFAIAFGAALVVQST